MTQRIIGNKVWGNRDEGLITAAISRLQRAAENDGESLTPQDVVRRLAELADAYPLEVSEQAKQDAIRYIEALPEPQRTMYHQHRAGVHAREIARRTGLSVRPVLKSLAKIYRDLRFILVPMQPHDSGDIART